MKIRALLTIWCFVAIGIAAILWAVNPAWPSGSAFDRRVAELLEWTADHTGYNADGVRVRVEFRSSEDINRRAFGAQYVDQDFRLAYSGPGYIALPTTFTIGRDEWMLVHELVHVLQWAADAEFRCEEAREYEAFEAQLAFVDETGIGASAEAQANDLFMVFMRGRARCRH